MIKIAQYQELLLIPAWISSFSFARVGCAAALIADVPRNKTKPIILPVLIKIAYRSVTSGTILRLRSSDKSGIGEMAPRIHVAAYYYAFFAIKCHHKFQLGLVNFQPVPRSRRIFTPRSRLSKG
jgi:hypothetical protein